ncbi:AraC family transcriptional regulator [Clostridium faecium]|uniref:helix-turn-helix domain-containing protein n=1 Tax=Clostridium faecium TaxID=2762223 RepID=UPI001FAB420D|nr:AraC family transcriptional regulator [Clostridium faecium]
MEHIFDANNIYEMVQSKISNKNGDSIITVTTVDNIKFTAYDICPNNVNRGLYIIGPYVSHKSKDIDIVFKPNCCIPHLISLLTNIAKDSPYIKQRQAIGKMPYSLHVKKALDYIDARYNESITLEDISDYLKINKCYFCNIIKKETGKTFSQLLNEVRIEKSKELLLKENSSILDVALSVGFNNQNYYNMTFKKLTNMTPLEFRNSKTT